MNSRQVIAAGAAAVSLGLGLDIGAASHVPNLSHPAEIAKLIDEAATAR